MSSCAKELKAANEQLRGHAFALSEQIMVQRHELDMVRKHAVALKDVNEKAAQDLQVANSEVDLCESALARSDRNHAGWVRRIQFGPMPCHGPIRLIWVCSMTFLKLNTAYATSAFLKSAPMKGWCC